MNIGVRHALPLLTPLSVFAGVSGHRAFCALTRVSVPGWVPRVGRGLLLAGAALVPLVHYPNYIGYFNAVVGTERGHQISMVAEDWGQDLPEVIAFAQQNRSRPLFVATYTKTEPYELRSAGVRAQQLTCNARLNKGESPVFAAIHNVNRVRHPECYPWLQRAKLTADINHHIRVYEVPPERPSPP